MYQLIGLMVLLFLFKNVDASGNRTGLIRGCYYQLSDSLPPSPIHAHLCTHIFAAFAKEENGQLSPGKEEDVELYHQLVALRSSNPNLTLIISVAGILEDVAATPFRRTRFAKSCVSFCDQYGFDGVDLDWEFPSYAQRAQYGALLAAIHHQFAVTATADPRTRYLLTAAVSATPWGARMHYDVPVLDRYLDLVNIMLYDLHYFPRDVTTGHHSPFKARATDLDPERNMVAAVSLYLRLGLSRDKAVVGIPAYARSFLLRDSQRHGIGDVAINHGPHNWMSYGEVCSVVEGGGVQVFDEESGVPYVYHDTLWLGYNDASSVERKCRWVVGEGLAGVFTWSVNDDDPGGTCQHTNTSYPVHHTIYNSLAGSGSDNHQRTKTTRKKTKPNTTTRKKI